MEADHKIKILIVDDDDFVRDAVKGYLESANKYHVLTAADGLEALDLINKEEIDCCFTDLAMPRLDGIELARRIHLQDNAIPVVVMTGYPSLGNAVDTMRNGVVDFLSKPFKMEEFHLIVERVMRERTLLVENILLKEEAKKNEKLMKVNQELHSKIKEIETMSLMLQELDGVTTSKDLFNAIVTLSGEVTACDEAHFFVIAQEICEPTIIASYFKKNEKKSAATSELIDGRTIRRVADDGMPLLIKGNNGDGSSMAIPLKIRDRVFGILLSIMRNRKSQFTERELYFLNFLSEKASSLVENMALYENICVNLFSTLYAFVKTLEARDPYTKQHSARVSTYGMVIARAMGCSQQAMEELNVAGTLHDIGKIGIPDIILLKPGRLTDEEYDCIKKHPIIGFNIISQLGMWTEEVRAIRHHHERWDGNGYPDRLREEEIPLLSRILSVADVYDALTSDRSYRKKMSDEDAVKIITENAGDQFDPEIVDVFQDLFHRGEFRT